MAEETIDISEEALKKESEALFALLNKDEFLEKDKIDVDSIVQKNPLLLGWKDFSAKVALPDLMEMYDQKEPIDKTIETSAVSLQTTERVLNNLQKTKQSGWLRDVENPTADVIAGISPIGETIGTQAVKNLSFLQSLQEEPSISDGDRNMVKTHTNGTYREFVDKLYDENGYGADKNQTNLQGQSPKSLIKEIVADRKKLLVESADRESMAVGGKEAPRKTLSIEELKNMKYQGTLTVEGADQLRKAEDEKKVADMVSQPGDRKRQKHESNDKFKDEDVIKYMYEDWILGGASWLFNKVEDSVLNVVDSAIDICATRAANRRENRDKAKSEKLQAASDKANAFAKMASQSQLDFKEDCKTKQALYDDIFTDLGNNWNNPHPNWKYFDKDDEFVKKLQANPTKSADFVKTLPEEYKNRLQLIGTTGKIAMALTAARMTEEFMGDDNQWRRSGEYLSDEELKEIFAQKTRDCQKDILKAVAVISEDTRLLSEAAYDNLQGPKPDLKTFTAANTGKEVNAFLKQLSEAVKNATTVQQKDLDDKAFDNFGSKKHDRSVARSIRNADNLIGKKIQNGAVYDNAIFKEEHSKERIEAKTGLFEEALKENNPNSLQKTIEHMKQLNLYQAQTMDARRRGIESRKQEVQKFKDKIVKRDPTIFNRMNKYNSGKGM